jgi:hypothetical protein
MSGDMPLMTWGHLGISGAMNLSLGANWTQQVTLFTNGIIGAAAYLTLAVPWFGSSGQLDKFIHGHDADNGDIRAFINGHEPIVSDTSLFVHGYDQRFDAMSLYSRGMFGSGIYLLACGGNANGQLGIGSGDPYVTTFRRALNNGSDNIQVAYPTSGYSSTIAISLGHSLAVDTSGNVWMFGRTSGELIPWFPEMPEMGGFFTWNESPTGVKQDLPDAAIAVFATENNSFAILTDGRVFGWGRNNEYQLGIGNNLPTNLPVQVSGIQNVVQIAGGTTHTLFLDTSGDV